MERMKPTVRRIEYVLVLAGMLVLVFFYSRPMLLCAAVGFLVLGLALAIGVQADAGRIRLELRAAAGAQTDQTLSIVLQARTRGPLLAAKYMIVEVETSSAMFGVKQTTRFQLPLRMRGGSYRTQLQIGLCGETQLRCVSVQVWDLLELFCARAAPFAPVRTTLYPCTQKLTLELSRSAPGTPRMDGQMQSRRGSDPSETFDVREYVPGDDVRAIHWKLSSKMDTVVVREPSDPSHFDIVLMPDLGRIQHGADSVPGESNAAVALTIALGEQLLQQSRMFCLAAVTRQGLQLYEVRTLQEFHKVLSTWMSVQLPEESGTGLRCFLAERLEQNFSRLCRNLQRSVGLGGHEPPDSSDGCRAEPDSASDRAAVRRIFAAGQCAVSERNAGAVGFHAEKTAKRAGAVPVWPVHSNFVHVRIPVPHAGADGCQPAARQNKAEGSHHALWRRSSAGGESVSRGHAQSRHE